MNTETTQNLGLRLPFISQVGSMFAGGSAPSSSIGRMAANAIESVIPGYGNSDPTSFSRSLLNQFKFQAKDGLQVAVFAPSGIAGSVNSANLPEAMAVFFNMASARIAEAREALKDLEPLCAADKKECCDDMRDVVRSKLDELESALGADFGRSQGWVNEIFEALDKTVGELETDFIDGKSAKCPEEERRFANIQVFRGGLSGLREQWTKFADKFLGKGGSVGISAARLQKRANICAQLIRQIVQGLAEAGFGEQLLSVEAAGEDGSDSVLAAIKRIEQFCKHRAPSLLRMLGDGSLQSLKSESEQLMKLAGALLKWVQEKLPEGTASDLFEDLKSCDESRLLEATEGVSGINFLLHGVLSAAAMIVQQLDSFYDEVDSLLPENPKCDIPAPVNDPKVLQSLQDQVNALNTAVEDLEKEPSKQALEGQIHKLREELDRLSRRVGQKSK